MARSILIAAWRDDSGKPHQVRDEQGSGQGPEDVADYHADAVLRRSAQFQPEAPLKLCASGCQGWMTLNSEEEIADAIVETWTCLVGAHHLVATLRDDDEDPTSFRASHARVLARLLRSFPRKN